MWQFLKTLKTFAMIEIEESEIDHFLDYLKRPSVMNKRKAEKLIDELNDVIIELREKVKTASTRMDKNLLYLQIENRKTQIKLAEQFL
jgi:uncharacterized coiled-coil protein SlyX